jgi:hypothetical protein
VNRESERIIKKTAFFTVEDSLQLAAGNLQLTFAKATKRGYVLFQAAGTASQV